MKEFFSHLLSKDGKVSSKILFGILMLIQAVILSYVKPINPDLISLINSFLLAGEVLLGVSIASDIAKHITKGKEDER